MPSLAKDAGRLLAALANVVVVVARRAGLTILILAGVAGVILAGVILYLFGWLIGIALAGLVIGWIAYQIIKDFIRGSK
ncbi:MAG: hypothetical protein KJ576_20950 [Proteobacteria bacterium]|nr:hypothetical protein [Pseudomonadota bacterium]